MGLRANLLAILGAVAAQLEAGVATRTLVGGLDEPKLRSCARLFERVSRGGFDDEVPPLSPRPPERDDTAAMRGAHRGRKFRRSAAAGPPRRHA